MIWKHLDLLSYRVPLAILEAVDVNSTLCDPLCPRCGYGLDGEFTAFCPVCGQRLNWMLWDDYVRFLRPPYTAPREERTILQIKAQFLNVWWEQICSLQSLTLKLIQICIKECEAYLENYKRKEEEAAEAYFWEHEYY